MSDLRPNKQTAPGDDPALVLAVLGVMVVAILGGGLVFLSAAITGHGAGGPVRWLVRPTGPRWSAGATVALVALLAVVAMPAAGITVGVVRARRRREWTDPLARSMSSARDMREMTADAVGRDTARLGAQRAGIGIGLGRAVAQRVELYATYEWSQVWIMGTRAGKTRHVAVRQIVEHGGPVVTTSNKRDTHDWCRGPRSEKGTVWVNDPQDIVGEPASWWWNPLSYVTTVERAEKLVALWAASRTSETVGSLDPYFDPEGRRYAANLLMAAASGGEDLIRLADWLTGREPAPGVPDPREYLRGAGYLMMAKDLDKIWQLAPEQRDGIVGTAASFFGFLRDPRYVRWITRQSAQDTRPEFDPAAFVRSTDTLFLVSKEGAGSARAITGALVAAVQAAGEHLAQHSGGRCPTPILFVLDEAANVCRWPELPSLYSHAGGQGMILVTILQSASQGREVWDQLGFRKMTGATNILACGRGLNDADDLHDLALLIGDRQTRHRSHSTGSKGHRSSSVDVREERIFSEADLRALPRGRAVLFASGARPILIETVDYTRQPWAWKVDASREHYSRLGAETGAAL